MSIHPGYSGQEFMPEAVDRIARLRAALPEHVHVQVDGGIDNETSAPRTTPARRCSSPAPRSSAATIRRRAYRRLVQALA